MDELDLLDWKRRVFALYARVRGSRHIEDVWREWRAVRDEMFATHPQSPLQESRRAGFTSLPYFEYSPRWRSTAKLAAADGATASVAGSAGTTFPVRRFARADFELGGQELSLPVFWIEAYGGGIFVPFRDLTSGTATYGGGRYLLDTVKGADLGGDATTLVFDFNFAYNPSCAYDDRWACPLAPPDSRLDLAIEAGERLSS